MIYKYMYRYKVIVYEYEAFTIGHKDALEKKRFKLIEMRSEVNERQGESLRIKH